MIAQLDPDYIRTIPFKAITRMNSYLFIEGRPLTTRGQWINPFVLAQLELVTKLPISTEVIKPIFILGMGRSGTTILGKVLSSHNQVGFLNEPKALWNVVYPHEDVIRTYSDEPGRLRLDENDFSESISRAAHKLYGYSMFITASRRIADKYPEMIFRIPFLRKIFPDAKYLFLVRNGWDTAQSVATWSKNKSVTKGNITHDWWGINNRKWKLLINDVVNNDPNLAEIGTIASKLDSDVDMAAVEWITIMQEGLRHIRSKSGDFFMVRFEEFVAHPTKVINHILKFCELPNDTRQLEYAQRILSPRPAYGECELHPALDGFFRKTMKELNYL
jgi:hypothetical protein